MLWLHRWWRTRIVRSNGTRRDPPGPRLRFERLEPRELLAVDLEITNVQFVDPHGSNAETPVYGQKTYVRAEWTFRELSGSESYLVRFDLDGVAVDSGVVEGHENPNGSYSWFQGGWFARPGTHTITVTVDADDTVAEADESNNTFTFTFSPVPPVSLPEKFATPIAGEQNVDWVIGGYPDVDASFEFMDYTGGVATNGT